MSTRKTIKQHNEFTALIWCIVCGAVCFAAHILLCENTDIRPSVSGLILISAYLLVVTAVSIGIYRHRRTHGAAEEQLSSNSNAIRDLLQQTNVPVVLTDGNGKIIWYNDCLAQSFGIGGSAIGTSMYLFCPVHESDLLAACEESSAGYDSDEAVSASVNGGDDKLSLVSIAGREYRADCRRVRAQIQDSVREFYMTLFVDETEKNSANRLLELSAPAVAYIVVDNLEELAQYIKVSHRQATNEIEQLLKGWADEMHGMLREYERDKYIMVFTRETLDRCIADKFTILDRIRSVKLGDDDTSMPVTVSMGISTAPFSTGNIFDMKALERDAASALDMALQRGGDQAAVKTEGGQEFFGGRTKSLQKRTCVRARVIANKLCTLITKSTRVLIMGHKNPDFDSIGACVGLARLSIHCGVDCKIIVDRDCENFRACTEKLLGLEEYSGMFIDSAAAIDLISPSVLLIIADANNFRIIESPEVAGNAKTIYVIDHHRQTAELPSQVVAPPYIDPAASSACELIAEILEQCLPAGTMLKEEANVMLSGIMVDTKNFTRTTSTRTFGAALYLRGEGANSEIARTFFNEEYTDYVAEAKFGADVTVYRKRIAITKSDGTGSPADRVAAAKAADKLLTIRGVDASFALVTIGSAVNISARSNGKINVQLILEKLNGGGHFDAAGAQVGDSSMSEAAALLKSAIDDYLDNQ